MSSKSVTDASVQCVCVCTVQGPFVQLSAHFLSTILILCVQSAVPCVAISKSSHIFFPTVVIQCVFPCALCKCVS